MSKTKTKPGEVIDLEVVKDTAKKPRTRPDRKEATALKVKPGDNAKILCHNLKLFNMGDVNMSSTEEVKQRIEDYFQTCIEDDMKASVEGAALAFGVSRVTLWRWANNAENRNLTDSTRNLIKKLYNILTAQMASYMENGQINPVVGIFLMKNNHNYSDQTEVVVTPNQNLGDSHSAEELRQKYMESISDSGSVATLPEGSDSGDFD